MERSKVRGILIVPYREIDLQPGFPHKTGSKNIKTQINNKQDTHLHGNSEECRHIHVVNIRVCRRQNICTADGSLGFPASVLVVFEHICLCDKTAETSGTSMSRLAHSV